MNEPLKIDASKILLVPLDQIDFDEKWNVRDPRYLDEGVTAEARGGGNEETEGMKGLQSLIGMEGQDTPVDLLPHPEPRKRAKTPYWLAAGYRRRRVIANMHAQSVQIPYEGTFDGKRVTTLPTGTIRAVVRPLPGDGSDARANWHEAKRRNIGENVEREDLRKVDLMFGLADYRSTAPEGKKLTQTEIAQRFGMNQSFAGVLLQIADKVKGNVEINVGSGDNVVKKKVSILEAWREAYVPIPVKAMKTLGELDVEKQGEEYAMLAGAKSASKTDPDAQGANKWVKASKEKAFKIGELVGRLHAAGHLDASEIVWEQAMIHFGIKLKGGKKNTATEGQLAKIALGAEEGFDAAIEAAAEAEAAESAEAEEAAKSKAEGKSKKGNGKAAAASA